jgi:radical SAM superfamily enzyme YgiQ (UPF0313 family)
MFKLENDKSQPVDVLLLHVPKFKNYARPIGDFSFILYPPIGMLGLAHFLIQNQHSARILHLAVEQHLRGPLSFDRILAAHPASLIGLDLHWHFQSWDTMEVARKIRQVRPDLPIVLGGFTASLFADEILRDFPCVDFIIRGEAEIPLLALIRTLPNGRNFRSVPNLSWRDGSAIAHNPTEWTADSAFLDSLSFTDFTLMEDYPHFIECFSRYIHLPGRSERLQRLLCAKSRAYPVCIARGCVHRCSFCGGSCEAQTLIADRRRVSIRSVDAIVSSIRDLHRYGFDRAVLAMDCFPLASADQTYIRIFDQVAASGLPINIDVERYFLPTEPFVHSFSRLPGKDSYISLSPHTHNEELRRRNGLHRYSNQALEDCLALLEAHNVNSVVFFTCGLPFETRDDLIRMAAWQRRLRAKFRKVHFKTSMIEIEPGSRMSRMPDGYGLQLERTTFSDYYRHHSDPGRNHWYEMGYNRHNCPTHGQVSSFFCAHFCERFGPHWTAPLMCNSVAALRSAGVLYAVDKAINLLP